ncbi:MAG: S10 family peptidase [Acidobacteriota bacterium]
MRRRLVPLAPLLLVLLAPTLGLAAPSSGGPQQETTDASTETDVPGEQVAETEHTIELDGETVPYRATAANMILEDEDGEPIGSLYYTAYTRTDVDDPSTRPVSFIYNGGPGSASMWLHMGAFGPRRIVVNDSGATPPAPYELVDNAGSLIDVTDMVFIDPVGTGFSRPVGEGEGSDFWGIDEDAASLTEFIYQYVTRNGRWNSPKFLMGESYGTTRSAVLVNRLQRRAGMDFNGVVLISAVLDFETLLFAEGHDISYVVYLPTYAATAAYHGMIPAPDDLETFLDEVREFALGDYHQALAQGARLPADTRQSIIERLAAYTGLSEDYIDRADLRVDASHFRAELQRTEGRSTARLDSRYEGFLTDLLNETAEYDPQSTAISGAYVAAINQYLRDVLGYESEHRYVGGGGVRDWNWSRAGSRGWAGATNVAPDLVEAMIRNPHLKVQFENGYYDLATPFFAVEYTDWHMGLPAELRDNLRHRYYEAGHMMYVVEEELLALKANVADFIEWATSGAE